MDDEHVFALVEAVHGAHRDAVHSFAANAAIVDDVCHQASFRSKSNCGCQRPPRSESTFFEIVLCLPTAPGCQLMEAATSVRRRHYGSSQASKMRDCA
jgi:hypothetical protein